MKSKHCNAITDSQHPATRSEHECSIKRGNDRAKTGCVQVTVSRVAGTNVDSEWKQAGPRP
eukprot:458531-Pyramimonas_sp.AAC.1